MFREKEVEKLKNQAEKMMPAQPIVSKKERGQYRLRLHSYVGCV